MPGRAQLTQDFHPIETRQPEIQDDEVVDAGGHLLEGGETITHPVDGITLVAQGFLYTSAD